MFLYVIIGNKEVNSQTSKVECNLKDVDLTAVETDTVHLASYRATSELSG